MPPKNDPVSSLTVPACLLILPLLVGACSTSPDPVGVVVMPPRAKEAPIPTAVRMYEPPSVGPLQRWNSTKAQVIKLLKTGSAE